MVVAGNILAELVAPIFSFALRTMPRSLAYLIAMVLLVSAGVLFGATIPMVCHQTVHSDGSPRQRLGPFYMSYIAGSILGIVGGYSLATLPPSAIGMLIAAVGFAVGFAVIYRSGAHNRQFAVANGLAGICALAILAPMTQSTYENLYSTNGGVFSRIVENRHGVIAISSDNRTVIGGGIYDGMFNVDPLNDVNGINRCYSVFGFLSRPPKHVLMVGLSSGSWAQVLANNPEVESLTIVEINPGYLKLIPEHPEVASILHNPKVTIIIDDGHRWLLRNPETKFDLIVMNTTFFWRANATNLLSREFLELVQRHLEPGGTHFYNTTSSPEAQYTAVSVFPYAVRIGNCIAASGDPLRFDADHWKGIMKAYRINGVPVFDLSRPNDQMYLDSIARDAQLASSSVNPIGKRFTFFEFETSLRSRWTGRTVVTDDNMAVEWRGERP